MYVAYVYLFSISGLTKPALMPTQSTSASAQCSSLMFQFPPSAAKVQLQYPTVVGLRVLHW